MITLYQNLIIHKLDGTEEIDSIINIYSKTGHFMRDGEELTSWHIELGSDDSAENYTEIDDGESHVIPESLPDICIYEEIDDEVNDDQITI